MADGFRAYKAGGQHRHIPEIEQELGRICDSEVRVTFTPHLLPTLRGILSTIYARPSQTVSITRPLHALYTEYYRREAFVRVLEPGTLPSTQYVRGSNYCDLVCLDERWGR